MQYLFRQATPVDLPQIWEILQKAIIRRKAEGSDQWQDGYPNPAVIEKDIARQAGFVMTDKDTVAGYCAILINEELTYENINGKWLTTGDFVVMHRVVLSEDYLGRGLSKTLLGFIEDFARERNIPSVKGDTNFDNAAMLHVFERAGYSYCGEIIVRGKPRKAYEKVLGKGI